MKKRRIIAFSVLAIVFVSMTIAVTTEARPPPEQLHFFRYWDDSASYSHSTSGTANGGTAYASHGNIDWLEVYADTDGWFETATARTFIDGGYENNSPWTFSIDESYVLRVYWDISGHFTRDNSNYLRFDYNLYYMVGSTEHSVLTNSITYTSSFDYTEQSVSHYVGSVGLDDAKTYYLECTIKLYHSTWSISTVSYTHLTLPTN